MEPKKTPEEIITEIDNKIRQSYKEWDSPEGLSILLMDLASLKLGLGYWVAYASDEERQAEGELKLKREQIKLELMENYKQSGTKADAKKVIETAEMSSEYYKLAYRKELYKIKHSDTQTMIDALRTRISLIKGDINLGA